VHHEGVEGTGIGYDLVFGTAELYSAGNEQILKAVETVLQRAALRSRRRKAQHENFLSTPSACTGLYFPLLPPACPVYSTCSEYAVEAFSSKSTLTAIRMTLVRIANAIPFIPAATTPLTPLESRALKPA
jgi:hypothetical protein